MDDHIDRLREALNLARLSPPRPTNFRVGAILLCPLSSSTPGSPSYEAFTGYTLELEGNTHAEQCCFLKAVPHYPQKRLPSDCILYTTMEPCNKRSPGNKTCVDRILELWDDAGNVAIRTVYVGVLEPATFVGVNEGRRRLEKAGVKVVKVECEEEMEAEILRVAKEGHGTVDQDGAE